MTTTQDRDLPLGWLRTADGGWLVPNYGPDTAVEFWAVLINTAATKTLDSAFALGQLLIDAKAALPHGEFVRLFDAHLISISHTSAVHLMGITKKFANQPAPVDLPKQWSVLVELLPVPLPHIERGIQEGVVTSAMTFREARAFAKSTAECREPTKATRMERTARLAKIRELAAEGCTSEQIAEEVGLHVATCKKEMKVAGIDCVADRTLGRSRKKMDSNRIVASIVDTFSDIQTDDRLIDFAALDPALLPDWINSLVSSQRALGAFINRLRRIKELANVSKKIHSTGIEDSEGRDQSDGGPAGVQGPATVHSITRRRAG